MAFNDMFGNSFGYQYLSEMEAIVVKKNIENQANTFIFPFTVYTGFQTLTEAGQQQTNAKPQNYTQFSRAFTGKEGIVAIWDNSLILEAVANDDGTIAENYYSKTIQRGTAFKGRIDNSVTSVEFTSTPGANYLGDFTDWQSTKRYSIETTYHIMESDLYKLYMIPELTDDKDHKTTQSATYQELRNSITLLYISNVETYYDSKGRFVYNRILFVSLNDALASTGGALFQTVQFASPGEGYAIPELIYDATNKVIDYKFNESFSVDRGVAAVQIEILGPGGFTAPIIFGRPCKVGEITPIYAPREIFPYEQLYPIADKLTKNSNPESVFYLVDAQPTIENYYKEWKERMKSDYTDALVKRFDGFFMSTKANVLNTNPNSLYIKDEGFQIAGTSAQVVNHDYDVRANGYFRLNDDPDNPLGNDTVNPFQSNIAYNSSISERMTLFSLMFRHMKTLPINTYQSIPWSLSDIPIIGGFLSKITLGIPIGWRKVSKQSDVTFPSFINLPIFMSAALYNWYINSFWDANSDEANAGSVPMEVFKTGSTDSINGIVGGGSMTTSFCFTLTDRVQLRFYDVANRNEASLLRVNSVMLGQKIKDLEKLPYYSSNGAVFANDWIGLANDEIKPENPTEEVSQLTYTTPDGTEHSAYLTDFYNGSVNNGKYIIDGIGFCGIAKAPVRITMWANNPDETDDVYNDIIYQTTLKSASLMTDNVRDIWSIWKLAYIDEFIKGQDPAPFPQPVKPSEPENPKPYETINIDLKFSLWEELYYSTSSSENGSLEEKIELFDYTSYGDFNNFANYYNDIQIKWQGHDNIGISGQDTTDNSLYVYATAASYPASNTMYNNFEMPDYTIPLSEIIGHNNNAYIFFDTLLCQASAMNVSMKSQITGGGSYDNITGTYIRIQVDDTLKKIYLIFHLEYLFDANVGTERGEVRWYINRLVDNTKFTINLKSK